jgi:hypothetical protein
MLHPIREIAHFMNWPYYSCPLHELGRKRTKNRPAREMGKSNMASGQFMKWEISRMGCNIYMNGMYIDTLSHSGYQDFARDVNVEPPECKVGYLSTPL